MQEPVVEGESRRARWLSTLAQSAEVSLESLYAALAPHDRSVVVRPAEPGLVMVRGRIGEGGQRFNLGEMTVCRCTVRTADGRLGVGHVQGRSRRKAELVARLDLLLQQMPEAFRLLAPLERELAAAREVVAQKAAATKVEFFTLVRGDP